MSPLRLRSHLFVLAFSTLLPVQHGATGDSADRRAKDSGSDRAADWVILVNGYDAAAVAGAIDDAILTRQGARPGAMRGVYSLACLMTPADLHRENVEKDAVPLRNAVGKVPTREKEISRVFT